MQTWIPQNWCLDGRGTVTAKVQPAQSAGRWVHERARLWHASTGTNNDEIESKWPLRRPLQRHLCHWRNLECVRARQSSTLIATSDGTPKSSQVARVAALMAATIDETARVPSHLRVFHARR